MNILPARAAVPVLTAVLTLAVLPSAAFGQATRTWVSGVGDDANPCSRTAPCKTFAGAISKTAAKGEINALDPGGFGAVTITKAIHIRARGVTAGVLTNAANAINVSAGATDRVTLSGLDINGLGTATSGVRFNSGKMLRIQDSEIYGFATSGVSFNATTSGAKLIIEDTRITNNGAGVNMSPASTVGSIRILDSSISDNGNGVFADGSVQAATVNIFNSFFSDNTTNALLSSGAQADIRIGGNHINGNAVGLATASGGKITSFGDNHIVGNGVDGGPTNTVLPG